jgi:glycosyltransferase involved in cell wall biosynthesis
VPEKRVDWLIRAFLQASIPTADGSGRLRLVVAGDDESPHDHARHLQELAGGDPRLLFTGNVGGQLKEELLSNARLFVTPSCVEGLPIALLEAMAHQRCCLASDIPPHREIIDPGREGVIFSCYDFDQLVATMEEILARDDGHRQAMGREAKRKVCEKYDWESVVDATEEMYRSLAARRRGARR